MSMLRTKLKGIEMQQNCFYLVAVVLCATVFCPAMWLTAGSAQAEEIEILKITVGTPTKMSPIGYQNSSSLAISRTGAVAAFFPRADHKMVYRISKDAGLTWGPELASPPPLAGGAASVALRDGSVLKFLTPGSAWPGEAEYSTSPMEGEFKDGWFTLHTTFAWFSDDFTQYDYAPVQVYMPDAVTTKKHEFGLCMWPMFDKGKIIQLKNGDLLAPMYGNFKGDRKVRVVLSSSNDRGHTWMFYATVAVEPFDPNPELPGDYTGFCEPSIALLPNGQMLCMMRTQGAHLPAQYRPMYASWSDDQGKTWTKPVPTKPHLMTIWPTLQVLDNGVVACIYGRPGFHVVFSTDNGHTWKDRVSFSDVPEPNVTGQVDGIKVGSNKLLAIGGIGSGGTQVFPITVERVKVSPAQVTLTGRVLDERGKPISGARVELSPNRYAADLWQESSELDPWKIGPRLVGSPELGYRSIRKKDGYPTVETDTQGHFRFESVRLGELILTVEAEGYAPQWRRVKVGPEPESQSADFSLKAGKAVHGRVLDSDGKVVTGASVVLNMWHVYSDSDGFFDWAVAQPVPEQVSIRVYKRYSDQYETLKVTVSFSQIEHHPIVLPRKG